MPTSRVCSYLDTDSLVSAVSCICSVVTDDLRHAAAYTTFLTLRTARDIRKTVPADATLVTYSVFHKKRGSELMSITLSNLTDFQNSSTVRLCDKFAIK